jgi:hypothetical protein
MTGKCSTWALAIAREVSKGGESSFSIAISPLLRTPLKAASLVPAFGRPSASPALAAFGRSVSLQCQNYLSRAPAPDPATAIA